MNNNFNPSLNKGRANYEKATGINLNRGRSSKIPEGTDFSARPTVTLNKPNGSGNFVPTCSSDPLCDDIASIYRLYREGRINAETAGSCITGKVRYTFITSLDKKSDSFDIETLKYLDSILFSDLKYLICSSFFYGSDEKIIDLMKRMITDTCATIDYSFVESEYNEVFRILDIVGQLTARR